LFSLLLRALAVDGPNIPSGFKPLSVWNLIRDVYNKGITRNKIYVYDSGKGFKVMVE
jgi:hypothetical protein